MLRIAQANEKELSAIVPLFDAYRIFYKQATDPKAATSFLRDRLANGDSVIFLAWHKDNAVGFTQLYRTYSSVALQPFWILNDLFVEEAYRNQGIGAALLDKAKHYCIASGYRGVALETASDNPAQKIYEKLDWERDSRFLHYFWRNTTTGR